MYVLDKKTSTIRPQIPIFGSRFSWIEGGMPTLEHNVEFCEKIPTFREIENESSHLARWLQEEAETTLAKTLAT